MPKKGWNSDCIHSSCAKEGVELWLYSQLLCQRRGELWLYLMAPCYARERVEIWGGSNCWTGIWKETMENGMEQFTYTVAANSCNCRCSRAVIQGRARIDSMEVNESSLGTGMLIENSECAYSQDSWILIRPLHFLAAASAPVIYLSAEASWARLNSGKYLCTIR